MSYNQVLIHKYTRRKKDHDYFSSCHYHIILRKASRCEYFGRLTGDARIPEGNPGCADINHTKIGKIIAGTAENPGGGFSLSMPVRRQQKILIDRGRKDAF